MAIWVKCATCGKRYQAADHMAGRRVRCKHCGTTFQLPVEPTSAEPFRPSVEGADPGHSAGGSILDEAHAHSYDEALPPVPPPVNDFDRPAPEIPAPFGDDQMDRPFESGGDGGDDADAVFDGAFSENVTTRGNPIFVFPGSRTLDRWLPTALAGLCVVWLAYMSLGSGVGEPPWVGALRFLLILLTYTGVVYPICLSGMRKASRKLTHQLPSGASWRTFATFLLPVTLGCVLWLGTGRLGGFLFGASMGLVVALPIMWFLFRIRPDDAVVSMKYAAGSYAAGVLASMALLGVLNLILLGVVRGAKAEHSLAISPFGPGFAWDGATTKAPPPAPPSKLAVLPERGEPITPTTKAFTDDPPGGPATPEAPPVAGVSPAVPVVTLPPGSVEAVAPVVPSPGPVPTPPVQPLPTPPPTTPAEVRAAEARQATPEAQPDTEIAAGAKRLEGPQFGSVVAEVIERMAGEMHAVVYPALPGDALAVVRSGRRANEDRVELWSSTDWKLKKAVTFSRPAEAVAGAAGAYHVSADGALLGRLSSFPYFSAQVYSFSKDALLRPFIKLDPAGPAPRLGGFVGPDQMLILFGAGAQSSAEVWDVNRVKRAQPIPISGCRATPGSYALSRDGKQLAVIARDDAAGPNAAGRIEVYNLANGKLTRRIVVDQLQWNASVKAAGLAFTDKADRIAVLFEHEGQGLFACWGANNEAPLQTHVYPGGLLPEGINMAKFRGQAFSLVDDGRAWLLYGSSVFDTETGKLLGDLGIKDVRSQNAVGPDRILLVQQPDGAPATALLEVKLNVKQARQELLRKR